MDLYMGRLFGRLTVTKRRLCCRCIKSADDYASILYRTEPTKVTRFIIGVFSIFVNYKT